MPVYNVALNDLIKRLIPQTEKLQITFEIRIADDASTSFEIQKANALLAEQNQCIYTVFHENRGRTATRHFLAKNALYDNLLFLDADVLPTKPDFLQIFEQNLGRAQVIFGGITYPKNIPSPERALHYTYGKSREGRSVSKRKKKPYLSLVSQHLLIDKSVFLKCNPAEENAYGLDPYFAHRLEQQQVSVLHINNPTTHFGLETSGSYVLKTHQALLTLVRLEHEEKMPRNYRPLQRVARQIVKRNLQHKLLRFFRRYEHHILKNLCANNPNLRLFDLYRLCYYLKLTLEDESN
ncbi:MAG: glycosyltransferase [Bacteroidota bacterium]|nr:glycosyltransferase [Bacteroidota bacterium]